MYGDRVTQFVQQHTQLSSRVVIPRPPVLMPSATIIAPSTPVQALDDITNTVEPSNRRTQRGAMSYIKLKGNNAISKTLT
jgi:hypothetical protein